MNHRDHKSAITAKRLREELDEDEASRIEDLLAAVQKKDKEMPVYREVNQQGATR